MTGVELVCPACRTGLREGDAGRRLSCGSCGRRYPIVLGIPDLRLEPDPYIDFEADRAKGREIERRSRGLGFAETVDLYYSMTSAVTPAQAKQFSVALAGAAERAADLLRGWADAGAPLAGRVLDLGCGTGPLLAAGRGLGAGLGVDIAFRWLVVGRKRLEELGVEAPLVCACAESLPFPDGSFDAVTAASCLEVVRRQEDAAAECHRVLRPGGRICVETPNRWSLGPDPHVGLWAGGWLPDRVTARYISMRGGVPPMRRLLSGRSLGGLLARSGFGDVRVWVPDVPVAAVRARFGAVAGRLATAYRRASSFPVVGPASAFVSPTVRAVGRKPEGLEDMERPCPPRTES